MDLIEQIGAVLGLAAFLGLAVLALLYFQQARDVRRLREWAGKAPERAAAAAEEAGLGQPAAEPDDEKGPGFFSRIGRRVRSAFAAVGGRFAAAWAAVDRRSPVDLRIVASVLAIGALVAAVFVLHPFGLLEEDEPSAGTQEPSKEAPPPGQIEVAILNGTSAAPDPINDLAGQVAPLVEEAGYELGRLGDAPAPFEATVIMYGGGNKAAASALAEDLAPDLGETPIELMSPEIRELSPGAQLALVVGPEDAQS